MLRKVGESAWPISEKDAVVSIKDASYPIPFTQGLEFNSPAHGCWNIVHTGMLIPEAHQIYVCADNCMRGVVLTAAEMCEEDRFSFVIVEEQNLLSGNLEDVTIEGTADILRKLKEREEKTGQKMPKAILLFTVCIHHFIGCDLERIYRELEEQFPEITFLRCYMDPIMQKHGPTPDQKLRKAIYEPLPKRKADEKAVSFLGSDFVLEKNADLKRIVRAHQGIFLELPGCKSWEDYLALSEGKLFISSYPPSKYGAEALSERLKRPYLYLPGSFDYEEITAQLENFCQAMGYGKLEETISVEEEIAACEKALEKADPKVLDEIDTLEQEYDRVCEKHADLWDKVDEAYFNLPDDYDFDNYDEVAFIRSLSFLTDAEKDALIADYNRLVELDNQLCKLYDTIWGNTGCESGICPF